MCYVLLVMFMCVREQEIFRGKLFPMRQNITLSRNTCENEWQVSMFKNFSHECRNRESAQYDCERDSSKDWFWLKMCGKHYQMWSKAEHCIKLWHPNFWTGLGQSVHCWLLSYPITQFNGAFTFSSVSLITCTQPCALPFATKYIFIL